MSKTKKWLVIALKFLAVYLITDTTGSLVRVLATILDGQHGAPSFLSTDFAIYGYIAKFLRLTAFFLLSRMIPVKGRVKKGLMFYGLYWISAYIPQILGMLGGHSSVMDPEAVSFWTICADSISFLIKGLTLGFFFGAESTMEKKECSRNNYRNACLTSMIVYPLVLVVLELLAGVYSHDLFCVNVFVIDKSDYISYYIVFYLFQAVSGLLFPVVYRMTEFNNKRSWFRFANIYGAMLFGPIVIIMMFFGIEAIPTIIWTIMMVAAIYIDTYIFTKIMNNSRI